MMDMSELIFVMEALADDVVALLRDAEWTPAQVIDRAGSAVRDADPVRVALWQLASEKYFSTPLG